MLVQAFGMVNNLGINIYTEFSASDHAGTYRRNGWNAGVGQGDVSPLAGHSDQHPGPDDDGGASIDQRLRTLSRGLPRSGLAHHSRALLRLGQFCGRASPFYLWRGTGDFSSGHMGHGVGAVPPLPQNPGAMERIREA